MGQYVGNDRPENLSRLTYQRDNITIAYPHCPKLSSIAKFQAGKHRTPFLVFGMTRPGIKLTTIEINTRRLIDRFPGCFLMSKPVRSCADTPRAVLTQRAHWALAQGPLSSKSSMGPETRASAFIRGSGLWPSWALGARAHELSLRIGHCTRRPNLKCFFFF